MLLIERYIIAEIRRPVSIMVGLLTFIFASYSAERYLAQAANGTLALQSVFDMVLYKVIIALEMLVPVALYASVALALGRLYHDSEMTAIFSSGASPMRVYRAIALIALPIAIAVTVLSLYGRPWAYSQIYLMEQQAKADIDVDHLLPQHFNLNDDNGRMILADTIDRSNGVLENALIYDPNAGKARVFRANKATVISASADDPILELSAGTSYSLAQQGIKDVTNVYNTMQLHLTPPDQTPDAKRKSTPTPILRASTDPLDRAELQWRESRGLGAILLALLAIPLSRTAPRKGRFSTLLPISVLFAVVFYAGNISRTLVGSTKLPLIPGVWLIALLMSLLLLVYLARDMAIFRRRAQ